MYNIIIIIILYAWLLLIIINEPFNQMLSAFLYDQKGSFGAVVIITFVNGLRLGFPSWLIIPLLLFAKLHSSSAILNKYSYIQLYAYDSSQFQEIHHPLMHPVHVLIHQHLQKKIPWLFFSNFTHVLMASSTCSMKLVRQYHLHVVGMYAWFIIACCTCCAGQ